MGTRDKGTDPGGHREFLEIETASGFRNTIVCDVDRLFRIRSSMPDNDASLRDNLVQLLRGGNAHVDVLSALKDFPPKHYGTKPENSPHSAWELLEHIRIALRDLWDFSTNDEYVEKEWPDDYWPKTAEPPSKEAWQNSVRALKEDLEAFEELIKNPDSNLYAQIPWGKKDQTLLREVLLAADHNSYHTGELVFLRRMLGAWNG